MKKVLSILSMVAIFGATACNKEYTCECKAYDSNGDLVTAASSTGTFESKKKSDAEETCDAGDQVTIFYTIDCELK